MAKNIGGKRRKKRDPLVITGTDRAPGEYIVVWRDEKNHVPETFAMEFKKGRAPKKLDPWAPNFYPPVENWDEFD